MLHLLYILAFTVIAFLAISNLIRSLINVSYASTRSYPNQETKQTNFVTHPELIDDRGRVIKEPLLVMRSVSVEDARQKLDALYNASPSQPRQDQDEE
ncbi:DUF2973 domain-containing protein [Gloeocapsa sp. PCC 73106]|uniref:DUF2973 domain-containing protein n=1 Tax=Gloeocapsa sp. PCC 73106 TaxID=102232 RepID=UPI0002ABA0FA|nr:DUF2973 domain-containing protein [Gloeocapsa sp. PCC 73106]ELR98882.1 Protein of unknown function (DUF2973) [Gloeocapsa sp. PCC 73106]